MRPGRLGAGPLHLAVDSTGVKLYGEGEWKVRLHGADRRRTWRKLHLYIDHRTQEAVAASMTEQYVLDRGELPRLLGEVEGEVAEVLGDGAYDVQGCYRAMRGRGARSVIPPKKRARVRGGAEFRDRDAAVLRGGRGRARRVEAGGGLPPAQPGRDGDDEAEDDLLRQAEGARVAEAGDRVASGVRRDEQDDELRDATELRRLSCQRSG